MNSDAMAHSTKNTNSSAISRIMEYATFNKFGVMSMMLIFVGCLSGVTVGLVGFNSDIALISIIVPTMTTLALILSVQPIKGILIAGLITTVIDILLLTTLIF
jgi:hypothetical protein